MFQTNLGQVVRNLPDHGLLVSARLLTHLGEGVSYRDSSESTTGAKRFGLKVQHKVSEYLASPPMEKSGWHTSWAHRAGGRKSLAQGSNPSFLP